MREAVSALLILFALTACSGLKLTYGQLDWILVERLDDYMTLTDQQDIAVGRHIQGLLHWHCATQVRDYAIWLREVNRDIQGGQLTPARLEHHSTRALSLWRRLVAEVVPYLTDILHTASEEQVVQIVERLDEDNAQLREEYLDRSEDELREDYAQRMRRHLRRWLGDLTHEQRQAVSDWGEGLVLLRTQRWDSRLSWQAALRRALQVRSDRRALHVRLKRLLTDPQGTWSDAYRAQVDANHALTEQLILQVTGSLTQAQLEQLEKRTNRYAEDLEELSCAPRQAFRHLPSAAIAVFPAVPRAFRNELPSGLPKSGTGQPLHSYCAATPSHRCRG